MVKKLISAMAFCLAALAAAGQKPVSLSSPDDRNRIDVTFDGGLRYSVTSDGEKVITPTPISMTFTDGSVWGAKYKSPKLTVKKIDGKIPAFAFIKDVVEDNYTQLVVEFGEGYAVEFRAYNDAVAYRFIGRTAKPVTVKDEYAAFPFAGDYAAWCPYSKPSDKPSISLSDQFNTSFENSYTCTKISGLDTKQLIFTPVAVALPSGRKAVIAESDMESYPGMFLNYDKKLGALKGMFAPYPVADEPSGRAPRLFSRKVTSAEGFIAKTDGKRTFPWRVVIIGEDRELLATDVVYRLASPSRIADTGWIKPGKATWEWWSGIALTGVPFRSGINTQTYKYFIDFAANNKLEYVLIDEGWNRPDNSDIFDNNPDVDLKEVVDHARSRNVGVLLWASYNSFDKDIDAICKHYAAMGVAGFKVDFMNRDDQKMVDFIYRAAGTCARYKLVLDFHGMYKPTGINRTWPNVLSFEGVRGNEHFHGTQPSPEFNQPVYDVSLPFLRNIAGPMDYTPGGMRNVNLADYAPAKVLPVVQGTRCHQMAMYVVFTSPLAMLCDSPSAYMREKECLDFIAPIPTVWEQTVPIEGAIGDYVVIARRKGDVWYIGGMTGDNAHEVTIDLSKLGNGNFDVELFSDGINADRDATDYSRTTLRPKDGKFKVKMAVGGGFAAKVTKTN